MDTELQQYLASMEERLMAHIEATFQRWAVPVETRARAHSAAIRAIEVEMEALTDRVGGRGTGKLARVPRKSPAPANGLTQAEEDIASALTNLGCGSRAKADEAARAALAEGPADFETLFKRALNVIRPARSA